jgi:hypothetical protein
MEGLTLPYDERSGEHRIVTADAGSLREIVAALRLLSSLTRSRGVSSSALAGALDELEIAVRTAQGSVAGSLLPSVEIVALATGLHAEAERTSEAILTTATGALRDVGDALARARSGRIKASGRLELERRCDAAAATLESVLVAIETLQRASVGHPIPLSVRDLLPAEEIESARDPSPNGAQRRVHVRASRALDAPDALVIVTAAIGGAVVRDLVEEVAAAQATDHVAVDAVREGRWLRLTIRPAAAGATTHRWRRRAIGAFGPDVARLAAAAAGFKVEAADRGLDLCMPCP